MKKHANPRPMVWAIFSLVLFGFGLWMQFGLHHTTESVRQATVLHKPRPLPKFELIATDEKPFDLVRVKGQWTFLFFGFTHCQSICPVTMAELSTMVHKITQQKPNAEPQIVMVTLDPARDDLQSLGQFVRSFYPKFIGARGATRDLQPLLKFFGIAYERVAAGKDVMIEHTGAVMLVNPQGQLVAFFTPPHRAEDMLHDYWVIRNSVTL